MARSSSSSKPGAPIMADGLAGGIAFLVFFSNAIFPPMIPVFAHEFHVSALSFKWLVPGFSFIYAIATLGHGVLSDLWGRLNILKRLLWFAGFAMAMLSFAASANQLTVLRALSGFSTGGVVTIALSVVGDRYPYRVQGRPMGRLFGAVAAGLGFGMSVGPVLTALLGWRWTLRLLAVAFVLVGFWIVEGEEQRTGALDCGHILRILARQYECILSTPRGRRALGFIFANGAFHGGIFAWLGVILAERYHLTPTSVGLIFAGYGLPSLLVGAKIGGWADRYGRRYVVPIGFLWAALCVAWLAFCGHPWTAALAVTALSIGFDATHPMMASITTSIDPSHRGQVTGMTTFANFTGMAIGALLFRALLPFGFSIALCVFALMEAVFGCAAMICFQTEAPLVLGELVRTDSTPPS